MARTAVISHSLAEWWTKFKLQWGDCKACPLHQCRERIVLFRGRIPADILFIGEAPGGSENEWGMPFVGPSGDYLDGLLAECGLDVDRCCFTNTVCCIPLNENSDTREPSKDEIKACSKRLTSFITFGARPRLIVYVGRIAAAATKGISGWSIAVKHPSYFLHLIETQPRRIPLERQRFILAIKAAMQEMKTDA